MPIKFACPQCKTTISVDEKMAGKVGKCKCGASLKIPQPRPVATPAAPTSPARQPVASGASRTPGPLANAPLQSGLASVFDDLTEADYNRQSPYQNVYAPPKAASTEAASLKRFDDGSVKKRKKGQPGELTGMLIFIAVLNFLWALGAIALAVLLVVAAAVLSQAVDTIPVLRAGVGVAASVLGVLAILSFAGGVGLLLRKQWGWFIVASNFAYAVVDRLFLIAMTIISGEFEVARLVGSFIGMLIVIAFAAYIFKDDTRGIFQIKTPTLPIIAAVVGVVLALVINGALLSMGAFTGEEL